MFDSDDIPLITRIESGAGISVAYSVNSDSEAVYTIQTEPRHIVFSRFDIDLDGGAITFYFEDSDGYDPDTFDSWKMSGYFDPTLVTITDSEVASARYQLTGGTGTWDGSGRIYTLFMNADDRANISSVPTLASNSDNTWIELNVTGLSVTGGVFDSSPQTNQVNSISDDATAPILVSATYNEGDSELVLVFSEPVDSSSLDLSVTGNITLLDSSITLVDDFSSNTTSFSDINRTLTISLTQAQIDAINSNVGGVDLTINVLTITDFAGNPIIPIISAAPLSVTLNRAMAAMTDISPVDSDWVLSVANPQVDSDFVTSQTETKKVVLNRWNLSLSGQSNTYEIEEHEGVTTQVNASSYVELFFRAEDSESIVRISDVNVAGIIIQDDPTATLASVSLTSEIVFISRDSEEVRVFIPITDDADTIKNTSGLGSNVLNSYLRLDPNSILLSGNLAFDGIADGSAEGVGTFYPDVTAPQVSAWDYDEGDSENAPLARITLTFDEPVNQSTFNFMSITFVNAIDGSQTFSLTSIEGSPVWSNTSKTVAFDIAWSGTGQPQTIQQLIDDDSDPGNLYLAATEFLVDDIEGNSLNPISTSNPLLVQNLTRRGTRGPEQERRAVTVSRYSLSLDPPSVELILQADDWNGSNNLGGQYITRIDPTKIQIGTDSDNLVSLQDTTVSVTGVISVLDFGRKDSLFANRNFPSSGLNTVLKLQRGAVELSGNYYLDVTQDLLNPVQFIDDLTQPELISVTFDQTDSTLQIRMSEGVDLDTFRASQISFLDQIAGTENALDSDAVSITNDSDSDTIHINLDSDTRVTLDGLVESGTAGSIFVSAVAGFAQDFNDNVAVGVSASDPREVDIVTVSTTPDSDWISREISSSIASAGALDSDAVTNLIDSDYVAARSVGGVDSDWVLSRLAELDSDEINALIVERIENLADSDFIVMYVDEQIESIPFDSEWILSVANPQVDSDWVRRLVSSSPDSEWVLNEIQKANAPILARLDAIEAALGINVAPPALSVDSDTVAGTIVYTQTDSDAVLTGDLTFRWRLLGLDAREVASQSTVVSAGATSNTPLEVLEFVLSENATINEHITDLTFESSGARPRITYFFESGSVGFQLLVEVVSTTDGSVFTVTQPV